MIKISKTIFISESDIQFHAIRASGPGGQHVNKSSTAIQLKFDLNHSNLSDDIKNRIRHLAGSALSKDGIITIKAQNYRSQVKNKSDALNRLRRLIEKALHKPKQRHSTPIPRREKENRLKNKKHQSQKKLLRKPPTQEND